MLRNETVYGRELTFAERSSKVPSIRRTLYKYKISNFGIADDLNVRGHCSQVKRESFSCFTMDALLVELPYVSRLEKKSARF